MVTSNTYYWNPFYQELTQLIGTEATLSLFHAYRGMQVTFPIRLISSEQLKEAIKIEQTTSTKSTKELAMKYGYSERHIQRILSEIRKG